jgi:hypothetical protein
MKRIGELVRDAAIEATGQAGETATDRGDGQGRDPAET